MSFRTFQRVTLMSLLALGAFSASACKEDKTTDEKTDESDTNAATVHESDAADMNRRRAI